MGSENQGTYVEPSNLYESYMKTHALWVLLLINPGIFYNVWLRSACEILSVSIRLAGVRQSISEGIPISVSHAFLEANVPWNAKFPLKEELQVNVEDDPCPMAASMLPTGRSPSGVLWPISSI